MKCLSLGEDNVTRETVRATVEDYHNLLELSFSNLGTRKAKDLWSRFWLLPEQVLVKVSDDRRSISFPDTRIRVRTETMRWDGGKLVPAGDRKDEKAAYFAQHMSRFYDQYAKQFPIFEDLRQITNMVAKDEHWKIERGEKEVLFSRNGVLKMKVVFDEKRRLKQIID